MARATLTITASIPTEQSYYGDAATADDAIAIARALKTAMEERAARLFPEAEVEISLSEHGQPCRAMTDEGDKPDVASACELPETAYMAAIREAMGD